MGVDGIKKTHRGLQASIHSSLKKNSADASERLVRRLELHTVFELHGMEARVCWAPHLFPLPHRAHAVAENLGTEGPHTYFYSSRATFLT